MQSVSSNNTLPAIPILEVVIEGKGEQGSDLWKEERSGASTAADAAESIGAGTWNGASSMAAWRRKTLNLGVVTNDSMEAGTANEGPIADLACTVMWISDLHQPRMYTSRRVRWLAASIDRVILDPEHANYRSCIECKFSLYVLYARPKLEHLIQVHQQMFVAQSRYWFIAYGHRKGATKAGAWRDGDALSVRVFLVEFSDSFWDWIYQRLVYFRRCIEEKTPPVEMNEVGRFLKDTWASPNSSQKSLLLREYDLPEEPKWALLGER